MNNIKDLGAIQDSRFPGNSANTKELYIVVTEDPTVKSKSRTWLAQRADLGGSSISVQGYEVANNSKIIAQLKDTKIYSDAVELAKKNGQEFETLIIPWHRVIRIKSFKFSVK